MKRSCGGGLERGIGSEVIGGVMEGVVEGGWGERL